MHEQRTVFRSVLWRLLRRVESFHTQPAPSCRFQMFNKTFNTNLNAFVICFISKIAYCICIQMLMQICDKQQKIPNTSNFYKRHHYWTRTTASGSCLPNLQDDLTACIVLMFIEVLSCRSVSCCPLLVLHYKCSLTLLQFY